MEFRRAIISSEEDAKEKKNNEADSFSIPREKSYYLGLWAESTLSQRAFCRKHQLNISTFNTWLRKERSIRSSEDQLGEAFKRQQLSTKLNTSAQIKNSTTLYGNDEFHDCYVELKLPNGCCLKFSLQANIKQIAIVARELLCELN